ncbi:glycosyltransferase [Catenovulum adriaticum]|uniref:Glycosyl transferase family 28 C-terminal domain-containing protein n=1 Tax=Catenovulum adriaticum TaxID=2984846 RepID=A0ABY7AN38_9ALTE|nr:glycosyltransferase [Catenovulum sp. TS8]WAJ70978.1 hypothetical protein OLW01_04025 [Catenovulum sp. TS8]
MEKPLIYVTTGTCHYKFDRMLRLVNQCIKQITTPYELVVQYGSSSNIKLYNSTRQTEFVSRDEAEGFYKNAALIFSHCGIGSIFNSIKHDTPTVIIPRLEKYKEFSDDHQLQIAREIATNPLLFLLEDNDPKVITKFMTFYQEGVNHDKTERDLVNYQLANHIKTVLYAE